MTRRAPGEGTLFFDKERQRWMGQIDAGINPSTGKRRRVKVTGQRGESKTQVARRLVARAAEVEATDPAGPATVRELVDLWLAKSAPKRMTPRTLDMVEGMMRIHVTPELGKVRIEALKPEDVERWLEARSGALAKSSLIKLRSYLAQAYDFALRRRHVTWNPARIAELPATVKPPTEVRSLTASEARALLNVADHHRLGAWVTTALTLGMRPGEVSGLTWDAVDLDTGVVVVHQSLSWVKGEPVLKSTKTGGTRTLDLPPRVIDTLAGHRKTQIEERLLMDDRWPLRWESLVFVTTNGTPLDPSNVRRLVADLGVDAGIGGAVSPYSLRHTATSLLSASGVPAELLADLLGHRDTRMVFKHYRHQVTPTISVARDFMDAALDG